jgi:hypothetical protein
MPFYFEQMFRTAVSGINATSVMPTVIQIASAILLASLLFNVYEAFVRGGDARTLAVGAAKYLILGLVFLNYDRIFLGVNTMFNQVAEFVSTVGPGGMDVFDTWRRDIAAQFQQAGTWESFWGLAVGTLTAILSMILLFVGFVAYAITYAIFCVLYSLYGSILYVVGPFVLSLYPALSTTPLARTYLTNLIVFHAWGLIYAIMGCLMWAINMGSVGQVLTAGSAGGFFLGSSQTLLLAMTSILFALCIGLIPFLARRIVQGDVGSSMFAIVGAAVTAAGLAAKAIAGASGGFQRHGLEDDPPGGGGGGGGKDRGSRDNHPGISDHSSQNPPRPPDGPPPPAQSDWPPKGGSGAPGDPPDATTSVQKDRSSGAGSTGDPAAPQTSHRADQQRGSPGHYANYSYAHAAGWALGALAGEGYRLMRRNFTSRVGTSERDEGR